MKMSSTEFDRGSTQPDERLVIDTTPVLIHTALPDGNLDFFGAEAIAALPYEQCLKRCPAHLQQSRKIDSFDKRSVQLGKALAQRFISELESKTEPELGHDSSTNCLI
jgi:glucose-6-phosphate isomerase